MSIFHRKEPIKYKPKKSDFPQPPKPKYRYVRPDYLVSMQQTEINGGGGEKYFSFRYYVENNSGEAVAGPFNYCREAYEWIDNGHPNTARKILVPN